MLLAPTGVYFPMTAQAGFLSEANIADLALVGALLCQQRTPVLL